MKKSFINNMLLCLALLLLLSGNTFASDFSEVKLTGLDHLVTLDSVLPRTPEVEMPRINVTKPTATIPVATNITATEIRQLSMASPGKGYFPYTIPITLGTVPSQGIEIYNKLCWNANTKELIIVTIEYGTQIDERLTMLSRTYFPPDTLINGGGLSVESWGWAPGYEGLVRFVAYRTRHYYDPNNLKFGQVFNERVQAQICYKVRPQRAQYIDFNYRLY